MHLSSGLASFLIFLSPALARPSVWDIHIFKGPAPSSEEGPPASANALRDPSKLKYEIIGICGAATAWIAFTLVLLFTVGRRLRRRAQSSNRTLSMEMLRAQRNIHGIMEVPPGPLSPGKMTSLKSWVSGGKHSHKQSNVSVSTINEKQVEADRQRNLDEMSRLYAAVMAHDEERSQQARSSAQTSPRSPQFAENKTSINFSRRDSRRGGPTPPLSPQYPPEFQHLRNAAAQAELQGEMPRHPLAPTPAGAHSTSTSRASTKVRASPLSLASSNKHDRTESANSARYRSGHGSIRGLPISQPVGMADLNQSVQYAEMRSPLSPRLYDPGPPPPTPGKQVVASAIEVEQRKHTPGGISIGGMTAANSSSSTLPFRQYQEALKSAPVTKTTFLERQMTDLGRHPKTGVPMSPYSPYVPFTPMTPVTPGRLVTREERKKQKKKEGLKVLSEDDMVVSDEDMWGG